MQIADDFIENVVSSSCELAKHRHSDTLEVKDVQLHLEKAWNMWIPGFGSEELKPYKRAPATEAHRQVSGCYIICTLVTSVIYINNMDNDSCILRIGSLLNLRNLLLLKQQSIFMKLLY